MVLFSHRSLVEAFWAVDGVWLVDDPMVLTLFVCGEYYQRRYVGIRQIAFRMVPVEGNGG